MKGRDLGSIAGVAGGMALGLPPGVTGAVGSLFGSFFDGDDDSAAREAYNRAMQEIEAVGAPPEEAKEILYKQFKQVGIEPELVERAMKLAPSKMAQIQEAPELRSAKMEALQSLREAGRGETLEQRAALQEGRLQAQRGTEAKIQQIKQQFQQRGGFSPSLELAAMMQAESAGSAQEAEERLKIQDIARRSALEAQSKAGGLASDISRQEFDVARAKAEAADVVNKFNVGQSADVQRRNIEAERERQLRTLTGAQRLSEKNIGMSNEELLRQQQARTQDWQRRLEYAKEKAGMYTGQGKREEAWAAQESARSGELARGITDVIKGTDWGGVKSTIGGLFDKKPSSSGFDWSRGIKDPMDEKMADKAALASLKKYGYPGAR